MATNVILPALGMSQDTGKIVQWLKSEGEHVAKGEPLAEIETDKATVEIDAPADGVLARVSASAGDDVPVGQVIALILSANETLPGDGADREDPQDTQTSNQPNSSNSPIQSYSTLVSKMASRPVAAVSTLASRIAADHNVDLSQVKPSGPRIQKADVLMYLRSQETPTANSTSRLVMASPKARRLATEVGKDLATIKGSGPNGAVLAADVLMPAGAVNVARTVGAINLARTEGVVNASRIAAFLPQSEEPVERANGTKDPALSTTWRVMAERTTQSWTDVPHFYLTREVNVTRLMSWREHIVGRHKRGPDDVKVTYTDLLVKIVATALRLHPRLNASWSTGKITLHSESHVGLAVAIEDGLVVPVIHHADTLGLDEIAQQRGELVTKAQAGKLRPQDISGGTFTISNLGMYNVDAFNAIINQPQAAILAVGRIAERVVPVHGQPTVQPMMTLTLSCDHRAVDGARGARFLDTIATCIEEPLGLLT